MGGVLYLRTKGGDFSGPLPNGTLTPPAGFRDGDDDQRLSTTRARGAKWSRTIARNIAGDTAKPARAIETADEIPTVRWA